jgi:hypothetical protein
MSGFVRLLARAAPRLASPIHRAVGRPLQQLQTASTSTSTSSFYSFAATPAAARAWTPYRKHACTPWRTVPPHIVAPPYAVTGEVGNSMNAATPEIKNEKQIAAMRRACALAGRTRAHIGEFVRPGVTTDELGTDSATVACNARQIFVVR